ncbi:MAG: hypothetical protein K2K89_06545 [Ruminococcus sp.]|nr:hypothetical protein [Ruminococcus sp.]
MTVNADEDNSSHNDNDNKGRADIKTDTKTDSVEKKSSNVGGVAVVCMGGATIIAGALAFWKIKGKK